MNAQTQAIVMTISGSVLTYLSHGAAFQFVAGAQQLDMAAEQKREPPALPCCA